jgi:hypothetical protein
LEEEVKTATVYWLDSARWTPVSKGEFTQKQVNDMTPCNMVSSGIIAKETDRNITLAKDFNIDSQTYRGVSLIPKCNITKIVRG